jgi:hypothetical protein
MPLVLLHAQLDRSDNITRLALRRSSFVAPARRGVAVSQYLSPENFSKPEQRQLRKVLLQQQFSRFPGDTGSTEVQGALPTALQAPCMSNAAIVLRASWGCSVVQCSAMGA